jgi:hypothetical protein
MRPFISAVALRFRRNKRAARANPRADCRGKAAKKL